MYRITIDVGGTFTDCLVMDEHGALRQFKSYTTPRDPSQGFLDAVTKAAIRHDGKGVYVNFLGDEGEARVREAYPGETYERLAEIKRAYDPENLFRFNQNIAPTA